MKKFFLTLVIFSGLVIFGQGQKKLDWIQANGLEVPDGSVRSILGSSLVLDSYTEHGDGTATFVLHGTAESDNIEWWDKLTVTFPAGFEIISLDVVDLEAGSLNSTPIMSGVGTNVAEYEVDGYPCSGLGFLETADTSDEALFTIVVDQGAASGMQVASFTIEGDNWQGGTDSVVCSTSSPCIFDACLGTQSPSSALDISFNVTLSVPTMSEWGLILLGLVMVISAVILMRKK